MPTPGRSFKPTVTVYASSSALNLISMPFVCNLSFCKRNFYFVFLQNTLFFLKLTKIMMEGGIPNFVVRSEGLGLECEGNQTC